jgi:galactonate dehydratase
MKITGIRTRIMGVPGRNWTFVFVETDAGLVGVGEATLENLELAVASTIEHMSEILIGQDPTRVEYLWQSLFKRFFWPVGAVVGSAMSGLDQAFWDIAGKALGVPVYRLLGGPVRDRIWAYARPDLFGLQEPEQTAEATLEAQGAGFSAFKISAPFERVEYAERDLIEGTVEVVRAARRVVGDSMHLMVDNHGRHGADTVIDLLRRLREYSLLFYEEPTRPDNIKVLERVAAAQTGVPLATGERLFTRWGFRELIESQAVSIVQPDICHAGGISEVRRIAAHAELYGQRLAPHNPLGPVSTAASIHLAAATPNFLMLEHCRRNPWFNGVQRGEPLQLHDGHFELPQGPGLGIELDEDVIARHPYQPRAFYDIRYPDGAVAEV